MLHWLINVIAFTQTSGIGYFNIHPCLKNIQTKNKIYLTCTFSLVMILPLSIARRPARGLVELFSSLIASLKKNKIRFKGNVFSFDQIKGWRRRGFNCEAKVWQDVLLTACLMSPLTWQGSWLGVGCSVAGFTHRLSFPLHRKQVIDVLLLCWSALFDLFIHLSRTER